MKWPLLWLRTLFSPIRQTLRHPDDEAINRARQIRRDQEQRLRIIEAEAEMLGHQHHGGAT